MLASRFFLLREVPLSATVQIEFVSQSFQVFEAYSLNGLLSSGSWVARSKLIAAVPLSIPIVGWHKPVGLVEILRIFTFQLHNKWRAELTSRLFPHSVPHDLPGFRLSISNCTKRPEHCAKMWKTCMQSCAVQTLSSLVTRNGPCERLLKCLKIAWPCERPLKCLLKIASSACFWLLRRNELATPISADSEKFENVLEWKDLYRFVGKLKNLNKPAVLVLSKSLLFATVLFSGCSISRGHSMSSDSFFILWGEFGSLSSKGDA